MVRGRMKRESNPAPGTKPAYTPQVDSTGNGDYKDVSPQNPWPSRDRDVEGRLQAIENKLDSVIENGAFKSQLTGSLVEQEMAFNGNIGAGVEVTAFEEEIPYDVVSIGFFVRNRSSTKFRMSLWQSSFNSYQLAASFVYNKSVDHPPAHSASQITVLRYANHLRLRIRNDDSVDGDFHARLAYYKVPVNEVF